MCHANQNRVQLQLRQRRMTWAWSILCNDFVIAEQGSWLASEQAGHLRLALERMHPELIGKLSLESYQADTVFS